MTTDQTKTKKSAKAEAPSGLQGVSAVERALTLLTAFQRGDGVVSLAELTKRTGLVKTTVMRMALSLESFGLIKRVDDGGYRLDAEVMRLAACYQHAFGLADHVTPVLERLARSTGETASFYTRRGEQRLCLFRVESASPIRMHVQPGDLRPMDKSAIAQVLRHFDVGRAAPKIDVPIYTCGVTDPHAAALATPVFGPGGSLLGALALSGPVTRLTADYAGKIRSDLKAAGDELTKSCGG
ncbi:transcriptional regulator (plasmid) [Azospirillum sp. B510]|uniref:IclR family transcriptional regulator n=1 Tax=Azospirillum sp. (strain B510) TaxID=137722 RepID=UPI0001C4BC01|nr:helix-turn-helix domain-containing protein [Azospirillum sp. B510]BAI74460.1 transcriptional regulator [Azospirillum sp. B510]